MIDQLVGFDVAKLAKEKGFKELCFYFYKRDNLQASYLENGSSSDTEFRVDLDDLLENYNNVHDFYCSVSTQSLLQKWLREVHKVHLHICYFPETSKWNVDIYKYEKDNGLMNNPLEFQDNKTYEQALEIGLHCALKIIN